MRSAFWCSLALTAYAYIGYPLWLRLWSRVHSRPVLASPITPNVSIIIAARNEATNLPRKLENLRQLEYPGEKLQIVIASDASTDSTADILLSHASSITPVILDRSEGKSGALNAAVQAASGDILVFLDVRQMVDPRAITELVNCFADPSVGAASGELLLESAPGSNSSEGLGIYWKIEKTIRKLESATGSVVGVTGAIYAMRSKLYVTMPPGTILDDVFVPMQVARAGYRVVFQPAATARDLLFVEEGKEFSRKVRTLTGNYQLLRIAPWLLTPANPLLFRFISHKLLRLAVPLFLVIMLAASAVAPGHLYRFFFVAQAIFYLMALSGIASPVTAKFKPIAIACTFVTLNAAAALALYNFLTGKRQVWIR
jgi:cellulose synthase/poly-beta-1,6-N-acetylglucosamine synthase-like glycosyltransferase